ncbi:MAG: hypothetical protein ACM3NZ_05820, partial [Betaproteobacteria bacterium]
MSKTSMSIFRWQVSVVVANQTLTKINVCSPRRHYRSTGPACGKTRNSMDEGCDMREWRASAPSLRGRRGVGRAA